MHSNSIPPTKTAMMMRTTYPLPHTRPVKTQSQRRRGIIKWSSTAVILFAFVRWRSMQSCSAVAIRRFTLQTRSHDSTQNTRSNCRSTSARLVPVERSHQQCSMHGLVVIVTLILTLHRLCFCTIRWIALNYPDIFLKICWTVKLIVVSLCAFGQVQKGDETEASYSNQARSIASSRNNSGITTELWRMSGDMYHICITSYNQPVVVQQQSDDRQSLREPVSYIASTLIVGTLGFCLMVQTKYYLCLGMMWFITQKQLCFLGSASISCTSGAPSLGSRLILTRICTPCFLELCFRILWRRSCIRPTLCHLQGLHV